jgi:hypothetical protein
VGYSDVLTLRRTRWLATKCWLRRTWQSVEAYQVWIEDINPDSLPRRTNDQLLVPLFHEQSIRSLQLRQINLYRLFLQCLRSHISQQATELRLPKVHGTRNAKQHRRSACHQWPSHGPPSVHDWVLWAVCRLVRLLSFRRRSTGNRLSETACNDAEA